MLQIVNPSDGTLISEVAEDEPASVCAKVSIARRAQTAWAATPLSKRIDALTQFRSLLLDNHDELCQTLTNEMGKPIRQSANELKGVLGRIDFFVNNVPAVLSSQTVFEDPAHKVREAISHEPLGVVVNISAWNYPYFVGANVFVPALLTGNAVIYKPSEFATLSGLAIGRLMHEAGVPEDVFSVVVGKGAIGQQLLLQDIDGVFFTGSYATGCKIATQLAGRLVKMQLELGGKDPVYVCDDANVEAAAQSLADGAFYNCGQSCCSVERIYVHERRYDAFVMAFVKEVKGFRVGHPLSEDTYIGPLARAGQIDFLSAQIADAGNKGAEILCGGYRVDCRGNYFQPTVLVNVDHRMDVMREESFGPIIGIQKVRDDAHAVELMNDTTYGLTASVYTPDQDRARGILSRIRSGSAYWNCCDRVSPRLPWSGYGRSGIGVTLSTYGLQAFTRPRAWHLCGA